MEIERSSAQVIPHHRFDPRTVTSLYNCAMSPYARNAISCRDDLMLAKGVCRKGASRKSSAAWLLRCLQAVFVPAAIAVAEA